MVPEFWIPPTHILDLRSRVRLRKALMDERSGWQRRIHAGLFHEGSPRVPELLSGQGRAALARVVLPDVARERVAVALRMIEAIDRELAPLERELAAFARRQPGCRALVGDDGVGALTATAILAELGDARRFQGMGRRATASPSHQSANPRCRARVSLRSRFAWDVGACFYRLAEAQRGHGA